MSNFSRQAFAARPLALLMVLFISACAVVPPAPGTLASALPAAWATPTARYALAGGGERLEYATGPFGRTTWMLDMDPGGRVVRAEQVLADTALQGLQGELPGMARQELLLRLGTPGNRRSGGRQGGEIWSWRYETHECLWFRVSIGDDGRVRDGAFYPDPACDMGPEGRH